MKMKFNQIIFVILLVELFIISVTSAENWKNVYKNSIKPIKHVEKNQFNVEKEISNENYYHNVFEMGKIAKQEANQVILKFQNQVFHLLDHITKPRFKEPGLSDKHSIHTYHKEPKWPIQFIPIQPVETTVKPTFPFVKPINPRVKLNKAIRRMDQYLQWNNSCSTHAFNTPSTPDFRSHVARISEAKCLENIWKIKVEEEKNRRFESCKRRNEVDLLSIPNGEDAGYGEFPHMGAIGWLASKEAQEEYDNKYIFMCGSTLISENFALTAYHCDVSPNDNNLVQRDALTPKIVRFGVEKLYKEDGFRKPQDAVIDKFISYPGGDKMRKVHDLALIKFKEPVYLSTLVQPACIVPESYERAHRATVSGWGVTQRTGSTLARELQKTDVDIIDNGLCNKKLRPKMRSLKILNQQMCATNLEVQTGACQGDSGGPLQEILETKTETTVYNVLGVVSYNFACASTKFPSVFTKIDHKDYMDWIEHIVWGNN